MEPTHATSDRLAASVAVVAIGWLAVVALLGLVLPHDVVPDTLFAVAPLIACSVLSPRVTAYFAVAAVLLVVGSGWWNDLWGTAQQWIRLLDVVLVSSAGVVVASVRVLREQRLTRVTAIAEAAQRAILPTVPAVTERLHISSRYLSAAQDAVVGGDLYDCSVTEGYTRFIVGDVRGKGLAAVEQAARVIRAFRQAAAARATLAEAAHDMNSYLIPFLGEEEFVTALLVDLTEPDTINLTSCGHPPAVLVRANGFAEFLEAPAGMPLGVGESTDAASFAWRPGDRVLLYTDGLSEARDGGGEFFPILEAGPLLAQGHVEEAIDTLVDRVRAHVPGGELSDDLAVLLLENAPAHEPSQHSRLVAAQPRRQG
jgi:phosphoserine phosphatase RsbU/P